MSSYCLVITEKPDAARRIALALDTKGKPETHHERHVPYWIAWRNKKLVIVPAIGHLYTVAKEHAGKDPYPIFTFRWVPRHIAERKAKHLARWIEVIAKLATEADMFVDACDYDIEGSIVGYMILKYACRNKENIAMRMKYSTLTNEELEKAYSSLLPQLDFAMVEAGQTRHEIDWLYGINLSRALTIAAKKASGRYATLSTGRVQGPTLKFVALREKAIKSFVPTPYWLVKAQIEITGSFFDAEYEKNPIKSREEADTVLSDCKGRDGKVEEIESKRLHQKPPPPFDLGSLQSEAYKLFKYTPKQTAEIAQHLYLDALISYPRTSSQKLPKTIGYKQILKKLCALPKYNKKALELLAKSELKPLEGVKQDPAHPAIYPTGHLPEKPLNTMEKNLWDLVIRRFMAVFAEPTTIETSNVHIAIGKHIFHLKGSQVIKKGWLHFYEPHTRSTETVLPPIKEGEILKVEKLFKEDRFTNPPSRYNPRTLLKKMEEHEIGTKATRAEIMHTLYKRKYLQGMEIAITNLGFEVLDVLEKHCPKIISVESTRELEERIGNIQNGKKEREKTLEEAISMLQKATSQLKANEKTIGIQLSKVLEKPKLAERIIGKCPSCKTGKLVILRSRKTGKRFIGCTNYFKGLCKTSYPLPQQGSVKPLATNCKLCGWPLIHVQMKGRYQWKLCFNPNCPRKKEKAKAF
ncbi:MAG: DNA topoisomerase I [Candidatus Bathyarchaeota archaeon]|nr:DNA topoisomerase I [Candidatus Bathyarchaeota archaeon]